MLNRNTSRRGSTSRKSVGFTLTSSGFTPGKGGAFTLIELLVVIAIIAILAAILFPVFAQARSKARQISGLSNIKQQALAILMYAQDYDEKWPLCGYGGEGQAGYDGSLEKPFNQYMGSEWQNVIMPYIKNGQLFESPGDAAAPTGWGVGSTDWTYTDGRFSLLINDLLSHTMGSTGDGFFSDQNNQDHRSTGTSFAYVTAPADCILLIEGRGGWTKQPGGAPVIPAWNGSVDPQSKWMKEHTISGKFTPFIAPRDHAGQNQINSGVPFYNGGMNVSFCDGHAKFVKVARDNGDPILCSSLPWVKNMDPTQKGLDKVPANPCDPNWQYAPGKGWSTTANWM